MRRRPDREGWWTTKNGHWISLGEKESDARKAFYKAHGNDEKSDDCALVATVLSRYLGWSLANHSARTHYRIKMNVEGFVRSLPAGIRIDKLLPIHLTEWLDQRCPRRPADGAKPCSDNTRHDYAADVLGAFTWAAKQRLILGSPLNGYTKAPKTPRLLYLFPEQVKELFSRIRDREFSDYWTVLFHTGCRPQEASLLQAQHVLKEGFIRIPKELAKGKREERLIPLADCLVPILQRLSLKYPEGPLLRNSCGQPWRKDAIKDRIRRMKLPFRVVAYSARHTFINECRNAGISDGVIAQICGHRDRTMILKVYGHPECRPDLLREAANRVSLRLGS
jgi:integrase